MPGGDAGRPGALTALCRGCGAMCLLGNVSAGQCVCCHCGHRDGGGRLQVPQRAAGLLHLLPEIPLRFHPFQLQLAAGHSVGTLILPSKT